MAQGRKALPPPQAVTVEMDEAAVAQAGRALTAMSEEALAVQRTFGLESMDPAILEEEIKAWIEQTGRSLYMIGARLIALRSVTTHGEWLPRLARIGIAARAAQKLMAAACKCVGTDGKPREKVLQLGRSKVLELVTLDDGQLDELEKTGAIAQLALEFDDIDRMGVSELKERLRETQFARDAKDKRLKAKTEELEQLKDQLERPFKPGPDSEAKTAEEQALLKQMRDLVVTAETALMQLASMSAAVMDSGHSDSMETAAHTSMEYLAQRTAEAVNASGTRVQFEELVTPGWIKAAAAKQRKAA